MLQTIAASVCLFWYLGLPVVCNIGFLQIIRYYRRRPSRAVCETLPHNEIPHITVIRPVKGVEPRLYECLTSTFHQTYPKDKLTLYFCVSTRSDPSYSILLRLLEDYPAFDAHVLVEEDDAALQTGDGSQMGPNPKIRNMSRAYREANGDIIWIVDCNVWIGKGVGGRMVDILNGYGRDKPKVPYKFVHQLPVVVDVTNDTPEISGSMPLLHHSSLPDTPSGVQAISTSTEAFEVKRQDLSSLSWFDWIKECGGGRLDELFLSSSHAKFYTAINTILIAPCIVGKSNMFRKSHLDSLTSNDPEGRPPGIDFFSHNICEDHLIGDLLWKRKVPAECGPNPQKFGKHCMAFGDPVIQPVAGMNLTEYVARRARWLRVRKFTVTAATLVEPGTESILDAFIGAYAITTLPFFQRHGIPPTWTSFFAIVFLSIFIWCMVDWTQYCILHSMAAIEIDEDTPSFARKRYGPNKRSFLQWLPAWLGRELLALPIWTWAVLGGVTVAWRGQKFKVGMDARVRAVDRPSSGRSSPRRLERGLPTSRVSSKARTE